MSQSKMYDYNLDAPVAKEINHVLEIHNDKRIDPYYWLNDRENPEVINYLQAENIYKEAMLAHLTDFRAQLYKEIRGRIKETDMSVPVFKNGYHYITRFEEGKEYAIHTRKQKSLDQPEEIILDVNLLAADKAYYAIGAVIISPNNQLAVYSEDTVSRRIYTLRIKNLMTGELYNDIIPGTSGSACWANDNASIFYTIKDPTTLRDYKIMRHRLGSPTEEDVEVYIEEDDMFHIGVSRSKSGKFIIIGSHSTLTTEYRYLSTDHPTEAFTLFQQRVRGIEYHPQHMDDQWFILTNWNALNFKIMQCPLMQTQHTDWRDFIGHRDHALVEEFQLFESFMAINERVDGISKVRIRPWEGNEHYIDFHEEAYTAQIGVNPEMQTTVVRVGYTSMTTPNTTYDYNTDSKSLQLLKQQEVLGEFNQDAYQSERIFAIANDGTHIPISLVYKKGTALDGTAPLLLNGYGSYGISEDPYFSISRLSLLNRGFIVALAHIRGGQDLGRAWYVNGKLLHKKNTFTDFINCAEHLIEKKYTNKNNLFALGGSAGGLLIGAVINMRPDLWKAVIAAVPFVDVITTMLDKSIPLTTGEYDEWGNPEDKTYYDYIKSYSPYDNVTHQNYPAMLVTTGLHDSQVQYWEPAKWVAKLRTHKTNNQPLLLHTNMETGHSGASGRFESIKEIAMEYAFLIDLAQQ